MFTYMLLHELSSSTANFVCGIKPVTVIKIKLKSRKHGGNSARFWTAIFSKWMERYSTQSVSVPLLIHCNVLTSVTELTLLIA